MMRRAIPFLVFLGLVGLQCNTREIPPPPPCDPIVFKGYEDKDFVWGFADLHAHPAIEVAFDGQLIWGTVLDEPRADANVLPMIEQCPVETHKHEATSPLDRAVGDSMFPLIAEVSGFPHAPVGVNSKAWPNARDVIHQGMSVSGIRRAYESGLRLMFASSTHDQAIASFLTRPDVSNGFVPSETADRESAKKQFDLIEKIVSKNATWMEVARTPEDARRIIKEGKLALVLSLEMNGLRPDQTDHFIDEGIQHTIPIHLVDNDVGGTAASGDLFNLTSSAHSALYRGDGTDLRYMDLAASPRYSRPLGWPVEVHTLDTAPLYIKPDDVPYARYAGLCYEPLGSCAGSQPPTTTSFVLLGQENARGLCARLDQCEAGMLPGADAIRHLMTKGILVDVTHMGRRSVRDTLAIDPTYPIIASHGDVQHLCDLGGVPCVDDVLGPVNERSLEAEYAKSIFDRGGVLGISNGAGVYAARSVLAGHGGPLLSFNPGAPTGCLARGTKGCREVTSNDAFDPTKPIDTIEVATNGGIPGDIIGNAHAFVRVEMRARTDAHSFQHRVFLQPMECNTQACTAKVNLGQRDEAFALGVDTNSATKSCDAFECGAKQLCGSTSYTLDDIELVGVEWQYLYCDTACQAKAQDATIALRQCRNTWKNDKAPHWVMNAIAMSAQSMPLVSIGADVPVVDLGNDRGRFTIFDRRDRPSVGENVPATGELLKVSMRAGTQLNGASPSEHGANVCIALRQRIGLNCVSTAPPLASGTTECTDGWTSFNQRGTWAQGVTLNAFLRFTGGESNICGLDVAVRDWNQDSFEIDDIRIEAAEDPVGRIVRRYAEVSKRVGGGRAGFLAFGTDYNGLNGLTDISEFPRPPGATAASICPIDGAPKPSAPTPIAPMRIRSPNGDLGDEVRIEERGFATYGLFADMMSIIRAYPDCGEDVYTSLMLSAEATLRAWELARAHAGIAAAPKHDALPNLTFACKRVPGLP